MKRRRKTIIAGPPPGQPDAGSLVKIVEYTPPMPRDNQQTRTARHRATSAAQRVLNHRTAQGKLETKLACNFSSRDYFITFNYTPGQEPATRKEANRHKRQYLRRLRTARSRRGQPLRWIMALENKHGEGRYHFHAVINSTGGDADAEEIISLWEYGKVHIARLFDAGHDSGADFNTWLQVAVYMTKERPEDGPDITPNGAQIYGCSRNLAKPIVITEWIDSGERVTIPPGAVAVEHEARQNDFSSYEYYRYMTEPLKGA